MFNHIEFITRPRCTDGEMYDNLASQIRCLVNEHNKFVFNRAHLLKTGEAKCDRTRELKPYISLVDEHTKAARLRDNERMRIELAALVGKVRRGASEPEQLSGTELIALHAHVVMALQDIIKPVSHDMA